jgi:primosomal protein N' (replication factor Y)
MARPVVGARVVVPLGSRVVTGIVMDDASAATIDDAAVKPIREVLDAEPFVPADVVGLALWTAEYYAAGPGDTITSVLPPKSRGGRADAHKTIRVASITAVGLDQVARPFQGRAGADGERPTRQDPRALTAKQREVLEALASAPDGISTPQLSARGIAADVIARLVRHGFVSMRQDRLDRDPFQTAVVEPAVVDPARRLTAEQAAAFARLSAMAEARRFQVALLHGVTGSGKTELYLRLSAAVRESGRSVLMLVPEIALTPVIASVFRHAFGERVAIQHSGLSDGERHDQWQRIRRGDVDVVVGTRSAVFAPLERVGLIVVDEEHDASQTGREPAVSGSRRRHHSRSARQRACRARFRDAVDGELLQRDHRTIRARRPRERVLDRPLATVRAVDMREVRERGPDVVLSRALEAALVARLERREQALVLLNRRGFATAVFCRQCAGTMDCPNCSESLVVHGEGASRRARCHYCNYTMRVPAACPHCAGPYLEQAGFGTERVEAEVRRLCPGARVARLDRDAIRRKGALTEILRAFEPATSMCWSARR